MKELKKDKSGKLTLDGRVVSAESVEEKKVVMSRIGYLVSGENYRKCHFKSAAPEGADGFLIKGSKKIGMDDSTAKQIFLVEFYKI